MGLELDVIGFARVLAFRIRSMFFHRHDIRFATARCRLGGDGSWELRSYFAISEVLPMVTGEKLWTASAALNFGSGCPR